MVVVQNGHGPPPDLASDHGHNGIGKKNILFQWYIYICICKYIYMYKYIYIYTCWDGWWLGLSSIIWIWWHYYYDWHSKIGTIMIIDGNRHNRGYSWGGTKWTIPSQSVGRPTLGNVSQDCGRFRKGLENEDLKNISTILISMVEYIYIYTYVYIYILMYIYIYMG